MSDDTKTTTDDLIGIGELPFTEKKDAQTPITPHIRYDDKVSEISDALKKGLSSQESGDGELAVDVYETTNYIYILAPIAGVAKEDITISITEDVLQIKGKRSLGKEIPPQNYVIRECFWGNFSRTIILPPEADPNSISASFKHAVLKIRIGKNELHKTRLIEINK